MRIFAAVKHTTLMITSRECISKIIPYKDEIMSKYGVRSMHIFGSVARSEQSESDVLRMHPNMDVILKNQIDHDGILVF